MRLPCEAGDFAGRQSVGGLGRKVKEHDYVGYMEAFALEKNKGPLSVYNRVASPHPRLTYCVRPRKMDWVHLDPDFAAGKKALVAEDGMERSRR